MRSEKRVLIIVPAFNEEGSIQEVIGGVKEHFPQADIIVVNDGSTDGTSERARGGMATVLDLPFNLGIGGAMQAGYRYAYEKGYDMAIQVDGDGQHDPAEISKLLDALETEKVDMVIGSRFIGNSNSEYKPALMRKFGISILSKVISSIVRQKISDPTSGFRVANRRTIELFAFNYPQDYPEPEVLVLLHRCDLKMKEIPVAMNDRASGESSITKFRSVYYMVKVLLAIFVDCFKTSHCRDGREEDL